MKQEQFKSIYEQIALTEQQKYSIWQHIEAESEQNPIRKKFSLTTRAAVCLGVLLMSGMTVFAATELSLTEKIDAAMHLLTQNKEESTDDQKNLYTEYGQALDCEIELNNGTLKLDAALYDQNQLLVPFRYIFHSDIEGYEELTVGTDLEQKKLSGLSKQYSQDIDLFISKYRFYIMQDSEKLVVDTGRHLISNPNITEEGTISGSLLFYTFEYKSFEPGSVIQLVRSTDTGAAAQTAENADMQTTNELCTEFTLGKALEQHELTIDAENAAALQDMGISVEQMSISPISLSYSGTGTHTKALSASITVILKDGSIIEPSPTGGGYSLSDTNRDNTSFSFFASKIFATPVMIEDIAEIHIQDYHDADIHIPVK